MKKKFVFLLPLLIFTLVFSSISLASKLDVSTRTDNYFSMEIKDADIRDVLSAVSIALKKSIVYTEQPEQVSFSVKNVSPKEALQILVTSLNMSYVEDGNIILVGNSNTIHQNFYTMLPITRFELKYLKPSDITQQISKFAIPVQNVVLDSSNKYIWAQGTPQALTKLRELIYVLDREENIDIEAPVDEEDIDYLELIPFELKHITSDVFANLIDQLYIPCDVVLIETNPYTIWIQADEIALTDIKTLAQSVDIEKNKVPDADEIIVKSNKISAKKMRNITAKNLLPMISGVNIPVEIFTIDSSAYSIWMRGDQDSIHLMNDLINNLDAHYSRDDVNFFTYTLTNITASYAISKLEFIALDDVDVFLINNPYLTNELFISCPADRINDVKIFLRKIDVLEPTIKAIVDYSNAPSGPTRLEKRRDLIVSLTGIPKTKFKVSGNVSRGPEPHYVLWAEETPDNIELIKEVIRSIDNP